MIKSFRKIRQKFLSENKFGKYVAYAIGEIILIIIGILIALQINNVNQQNQDRDYELKMLNNIRNDLIADIQFCEMLLVRVKRKDLATQQLLNYFGTMNDSLVSDYFLSMSAGIVYNYRKGSYEALKSTGLDKIANDSIRTQLANLYDFVYPRISKAIKEEENDKLQLIEKLAHELFSPILKVDDQGNRSIGFVARERNVLKDERFLNIIEIYEDKAREETEWINYVLLNSNSFLSMLNKELKESFPLANMNKEEIESIGILGSATEVGWKNDLDMQDEDKDGIYIIETNLIDGEIKFRANDDWKINWGGYLFPKGIGFQDDGNIRVRSGRYKISLNSKTGFYYFDKLE